MTTAPAISTLPAKSLRLDPHNPRLWFLVPKPQTQEEIAYALADRANIIMQSMAAGMYQAPEPLLVCQEEHATTVLDGNVRLIAIRALTEPDFAEQIKPRLHKRMPPDVSDDVAQAISQVQVAHYTDRESAYPVRLHRQAIAGERWMCQLTSSHDFRRLAEAGIPRSTIATWYHLHETVIHRQIQALNLFQQLDETHPGTWEGRQRFNVLSHALSMPNIRQHLNLKDQSEAPDRYDPLESEDDIQRGRDLLTILHGQPPRGRRPARQPAVGYRDGSMNALDSVYSDPEAIKRLLDSPGLNAQDIVRWMNNIPDPHRQREIASDIHALATNQLRALKQERPDLLPNPGDTSVARTAHIAYNDGSDHYVVTLMSTAASPDPTVATELQTLIAEYGHQCHVEIKPA